VADPSSTIVFPVIHGTGGEDGSLQGLLDMANVAYVGADTLASAIGMNKLVAKKLVEAEGIPIVPYVSLRRYEWEERGEALLEDMRSKLSWPVFVKPASLGSSVGISRVKDRAGLVSAIDEALRFDERVLVETGLLVREIEFALMGGYEPLVSAAGEVISDAGFYSYDEKYSAKSRALVKVPAALDPAKECEGQELARRIFKALELHGMARIDLFLTKDTGQYYFNEVNTIPGFTSISQFPQLWQHAGLSPTQLIDRLIESAQDRARERAALLRVL
jgi:D-alanine-D-alanine ligase